MILQLYKRKENILQSIYFFVLSIVAATFFISLSPFNKLSQKILMDFGNEPYFIHA